MKPTQIWDMTATSEQPPLLKDVLGRLVQRAWLIEFASDPSMLVVRMEGQFMFTFQRNKDTVGVEAITIHAGRAKPGSDWSFLDFCSAPNKHLEELAGLPFTGIDGPVVSFGRVGVKLALDGMHWMMRSR